MVDLTCRFKYEILCGKVSCFHNKLIIKCIFWKQKFETLSFCCKKLILCTKPLCVPWRNFSFKNKQTSSVFIEAGHTCTCSVCMLCSVSPSAVLSPLFSVSDVLSSLYPDYIIFPQLIKNVQASI